MWAWKIVNISRCFQEILRKRFKNSLLISSFTMRELTVSVETRLDYSQYRQRYVFLTTSNQCLFFVLSLPCDFSSSQVVRDKFKCYICEISVRIENFAQILCHKSLAVLSDLDSFLCRVSVTEMKLYSEWRESVIFQLRWYWAVATCRIRMKSSRSRFWIFMRKISSIRCLQYLVRRKWMSSFANRPIFFVIE